MREALITTYARNLVRIVHISLQGTHLHLLVEAPNRHSLARGMQGFEIAAAKLINKVISQRTGKKRKGTVFPDRYHAVVIRSPRQARNNLAYVLQNWRRHQETGARFAKQWSIDFLSSAPSFDGFKDLDPRALASGPGLPPLPVSSPRTWLLAVGWRRHGLVSVSEVPGPLPPAVVRDGKRAMARR